MAIIGDVELLVTPDQLNTKAAEVEKKVAKMRERFDSMQRIVMDRSKSYWQGEAGDQHRKNYEEQLSNIESALNRLSEHPGDLRTIAQKYSDTELKIENLVMSELPGDVL